VIAGFDLHVVRLLVSFGLLRSILKQEHLGGGLNRVDKMMILWVVVNAIMNVVLWRTMSSVLNRLGMMYDALGIYFLFRSWIGTPEEMNAAIRQVAVIIVPLMLLMLLEKKTGRNLFSVFGGVGEYSWVRDGKLRAQGPFRQRIDISFFLVPALFGAKLAVATCATES
jgi:hypothetical protein